MQKRIDLHIHTIVSDGMLTPKEVIDEAHRNGVSIIAIADHDTVDAYNDELFEYAKSKNRCPAVTYLLIRENDNRLIGMINIRHNLNETMLRFGGHIGYGVRPSEKRKGYNKINLYLGLIKAYNEFDLIKLCLTAMLII